jgi:hypothetical protein
MPYVDLLFWNTGMFEATLEGISERPVAECTAVLVADALTRSFEGHVIPVNVDAQGFEHLYEKALFCQADVAVPLSGGSVHRMRSVSIRALPRHCNLEIGLSP